MIASLDLLTPTTREAARAWLEASVAVVDADLRDGVRDELTIALCEGVDADSTADDLARVVGRLGPVEAETAAPGEAAGDPRVGTWHGVPYDWRRPTGERIRASMWAPTDPRLLRPRAFGAGWDVNVGALAVKLGLIEPDAEDEPFTNTPSDAFVLAAGVPALLASAVVAHYVARGRSLPDRLPSHWNAAGEPDRWVSRRAAAATDIAVSLGATALGVGAAASGAHGGGRAGRLAMACAAAAAAATVTITRSSRTGGWWVGPALAVATSGAAGATLLGLAWAGRDAERRRDLGA